MLTRVVLDAIDSYKKMKEHQLAAARAHKEIEEARNIFTSSQNDAFKSLKVLVDEWVEQPAEAETNNQEK